ncbi:hypothetical protein AOQ84DRAFT_230613 [Glonium stellatum]|uniref:Uncharacterized protein n=1 Tax=Glonium stellatum TaxID=574774 RepID=A0A8E2JUY8_9PEZI|nr:hypothetical protein AOQ84DRAFT_230613 [Glonium stellatum]
MKVSRSGFDGQRIGVWVGRFGLNTRALLWGRDTKGSSRRLNAAKLALPPRLKDYLGRFGMVAWIPEHWAAAGLAQSQSPNREPAYPSDIAEIHYLHPRGLTKASLTAPRLLYFFLESCKYYCKYHRKHNSPFIFSSIKLRESNIRAGGEQCDLAVRVQRATCRRVSLSTFVLKGNFPFQESRSRYKDSISPRDELGSVI